LKKLFLKKQKQPTLHKKLDTIVKNKQNKLLSKKNNIPVREQTYEYLKEKVLSGTFSPGERLTEEHLAEELGVSRTPVREALHKMELEGLVKPLETRGYCVAQDSLEEMGEVFDIRAIMEGYALRVVSETITENSIQKLNGFIEKAEAALKKKKTENVFKYNTEFHDTLYGLISHQKPRLLSLMGDMRKYVLRYRKSTLHYLNGAQRSIDGHKKILLALKLKDADLCERIMREHVYEAREDALQSILEYSSNNLLPQPYRRKNK
jgi:DNA-binding GntR family transcriptional regulator